MVLHTSGSGREKKGGLVITTERTATITPPDSAMGGEQVYVRGVEGEKKKKRLTGNPFSRSLP